MSASGAIKYWADGSTDVIPNPIPCDIEEAFPFVVEMSGNHWVACNVLVFARDVFHAKERVIAALQEAAAKDYHGYHGVLVGNQTKSLSRNRAHKLLEELAADRLTLTCEPYDIQTIAKVAWAGNDTIT